MWICEYATQGWWIVTDGITEFQTQDKASADWLKNTLNENSIECPL